MAYTVFDRFVAWCRFRAARRYVSRGARVCDLGCGLRSDFLWWLGPQISLGVGVDVQVLAAGSRTQRVVVGDIARGLPIKSAQFNHVTMLAVLEHLADPEGVLREAHRILAPGGSLIMTWPNAAVDPVLHVLRKLGIVSQEMESEKHEARIPLQKLQNILLRMGFERGSHRTFEFGLNNLLVTGKRPRK
jgi:2-polyprenyl-3-methyl-5-hydroxy-6-metoxy-1,4-benzoquinol methylase